MNTTQRPSIDIQDINEFFAHGLKMLAQLEKSTSEHAAFNVAQFRTALCDSWIHVADALPKVLSVSTMIKAEDLEVT